MTDAALLRRFARAWAESAAVIVLFVVGAAAFVAVFVALWFAPLFVWQYLEFGVYPWQTWVFYGSNATEPPWAWVIAELVWLLAIVATVLAVAKLEEMGAEA